MPLLARGSLNDELETNGPFTLQQATLDVALAAEALEFAHERGVLHRDIKPGNLLRSNDGSIVVTDFGIARVIDAGITSATVGATTPLYAAPEILADNDASVRSEVYALGALLYALLAGRAAFSDSDNIWATMHRVRTEAPPPLEHVPGPVMRLIQQSMAKSPGDRPATAGTFRELLRVALTSDDTWSPPGNEVVLGPSLLEPESVPIVTAVQAPRPITETQTLPDTRTPPPAPARHRPAPVMGTAPRRDSSAPKFIAALVALALVAGLAWWGTTSLLQGSELGDTAVAPPVDNSLPSPASPPTAVDTDEPADEGQDEPADEGISADDLPVPENIPNRFVSFEGQFYSALFPEGWSLVTPDIDEGYGFRSTFVAEDMYLNVDTTPREQRTPGLDIAQSARDIASGISSASEVRTEEVDGLVMHSFTFRNRDGVDSIDIFFEVDGDGYAVVAGSATDPDTAFAIARLVALSIVSNPDT